MHDNLLALVEKYQNNIQYYQNSSYSEAQLRLDFIDPFFSILGWDVNNSKSSLANEREVIVEEVLRDGISTHGKKPDYSFRLFSDRKFFVEAKKPSINIIEGAEEARQVRRYGFTAKLPISVLTNFEYLVIYDCSKPVSENDNASHSVIARYHYTEYVERADEIYRRLSRNSVYEGVFDDEWKEIEDKIQKLNVNTLFLKQINEWRVRLAENFILIKPDMSQNILNNIVQAYLNSIIFLRVCEDRGIENPYTLLDLAKNYNHKKLVNKIKEADRKYNAGLFDLPFADELINDQESYLWTVIKQLYYPESPFSFIVLPSDILGQIYEIFLGSEVAISSGVIKVVPKDVDRDIVTTPTFIIKRIIEGTIVEYCKGKSVAQILDSKFSDISCGSGAFLLEVLETLQEIITAKYLSVGDISKLDMINKDTYKLKYYIKQQILTACIYGIDKDYNATKATQFGLLLKLLENESQDTITSPALPNLDDNILFGNSLVDPSYIEDDSIETIQSINPFPFDALIFDVIIGNPPYLSTEHMTSSTSKQEIDIYKKHYNVAYKQFDKYYLFIERAIQLLNPNGYLGYIIPSKFIKVDSARNLRKLLIKNDFLKEVVYFGKHQVFDNKTTYTALVFGSKKNSFNTFIFTEIFDLKRWRTKEGIQIHNVAEQRIKEAKHQEEIRAIKEKSKKDRSQIAIRYFSDREHLDDDIWNLKLDDRCYVSDLRTKSANLESIVGEGNVGNGIQTSANKEYIHKPTRITNNFIYFEYKGITYKVEKELTRPYYATAFQDSDDSFYTYKDVEPNSFVIFPYRRIGDKIQLVSLHEIRLNYPELYSYLQVVKPILSRDKRSIEPTPKTSDEWHRYGRHQALENCDVDQKIIVGVLSQGCKYSIDYNKTFITSGGTAGYCYINVPNNCNYSIYYIQAILNSKYVENYIYISGEIFRGEYIARGTKVLKQIPIPVINFDDFELKQLHDDLAAIQKEMNETYGLILEMKNEPARRKPIERKFKFLEEKMSLKLKQLYSFIHDENVPSIKELYS